MIQVMIQAMDTGNDTRNDTDNDTGSDTGIDTGNDAGNDTGKVVTSSLTCRRDVPMQSTPVSPPPRTRTRLSLAFIAR